jgi:uncharacterized membrane protein YphA (DoxX/SURF4 family)
MRTAVNIARILVGCLFIFSGLVKAIDPLGLAYKMQEFFEVWAREGYMKGMMMWLYDYALWFSLIMITLEVILGVALLLGWRTRLVSWLLLLLMLFFTFLTSYVLFSGKIKACGCFGDCIPLTPMQTFTKDIILLILVLLILFGRKYIRPAFSNIMNVAILFIALLLVAGLQWYVLKYLPIKDCLPFKAGNNILDLRKMPADAVPDKYDYVFVYEKGNTKKEFKVDALPDSTWQFVSREQILIEKGRNNVPLINDFILAAASGADTTQAVLSTAGEYYLLFVKDISKIEKDWVTDQVVVGEVVKNGKKIFVVASQRKNAEDRYRSLNIPVLTGDATAIKTAARNNVTLYRMNGPFVMNKWGGNDIEQALNK